MGGEVDLVGYENLHCEPKVFITHFRIAIMTLENLKSP